MSFKAQDFEKTSVLGVEKALNEFCDNYFASDTEVENYCKKNTYLKMRTTINLILGLDY